MAATTRRRDIEVDRVQAAIEDAEQRTSAEIVVSIAPFFIGRVAHAADRAFRRLAIARTAQRNGVLVFVVPARRQVVVLPDIGAEARLAPAVWRSSAARIAAGFGGGRGTDGLIDGIQRLAGELAVAFPPNRELGNELPDVPDLAR